MNKTSALFSGVLTTAVLAFGSPAQANEEALRKEIQELRQLVKELQSEVRSAKPADSAAATPAGKAEPDSSTAKGLQAIGNEPASRDDLESLKDILEEKLDRRLATKSRVNFGGSGIIGYNDTRGNSSTFRVSQAAVNFSGLLREDPVDENDVRYRVALAYAGPSSASGSSSTNITDAVITWDIKRGKGEREPFFTIGAALGQQLVPYGSDNTASEDKQPTINKAQYVSRYNLGRDVGVTIDGGWLFRNDPTSNASIPVLAYTVGVYNGAVRPSGAAAAAWGPTVSNGVASFSGTTANRWDNNDQKDVLAKLVWSPTAAYFSFFQGLKIGGDYYFGRDSSSNLLRERAGVEFEWLKKPFLTTAEYHQGRDSYITGTTGAAAHHILVKSESIVATLFYRPNTLPDFEPLIRFDRFDADNSLAKTVYTIGFNYYWWQVEPIVRRRYATLPTERVVKLQVNYNFVQEQGPKVQDDQFLAQLVFSF